MEKFKHTNDRILGDNVVAGPLDQEQRDGSLGVEGWLFKALHQFQCPIVIPYHERDHIRIEIVQLTCLPGDGIWLSDWDLLMETRPCDWVTNRSTDRLGVGSSKTSDSGESSTENGKRPHCWRGCMLRVLAVVGRLLLDERIRKG